MKKLLLISTIVFLMSGISVAQCPQKEFDAQFLKEVTDVNLKKKYFEYIGEARRNQWNEAAFDTLKKESFVDARVKKWGGSQVAAVLYDYTIGDMKTGTGEAYNNKGYFASFNVTMKATIISTFKSGPKQELTRKVETKEFNYTFYFAPWAIDEVAVASKEISTNIEPLGANDDPIKGIKGSKIIIPGYRFKTVFEGKLSMFKASSPGGFFI